MTAVVDHIVECQVTKNYTSQPQNIEHQEFLFICNVRSLLAQFLMAIFGSIYHDLRQLNLVFDFLREDHYLVSKVSNSSSTMAVFFKTIPSRSSRYRVGTPSTA